MGTARTLGSYGLSLRRRVTPTGWGLGGLGLASASLGERYHWVELQHLGLTVVGALVLGLALVLLPQRPKVTLSLRPSRVTVGGRAVALLEVRSGGLPLVAPAFTVPAGLLSATVRPALVTRARPADLEVRLDTSRRGVVAVGPVAHVRSDLFGAFVRQRSVAPLQLLHVRPATVSLPSLGAGIVHDLEGVASNQLTASDLSFHALREYERGDDPRHVHWKSSARAGALLVRQFQLTRHSHATVVLDPDAGSYADRGEFELAVSIVSSVAVRAAADGFEVAFACGDVALTTSEIPLLLDLACRFERGPSDLQETCARTAQGMGSTSLVVTVTGSGADERAVRHATGHFPVSADVLGIRAERGSEPRAIRNGTTTSVVLSGLDQLPSLLARTQG